MNAEAPVRKILVFGASGLIGRFVTDDLRARGFDVIGVARKISRSHSVSASRPDPRSC
jgi:nucleoside-diphosphate-sugar epimerase